MDHSSSYMSLWCITLRPRWRVCEAHIYQGYKLCVIGAISIANLWECVVLVPLAPTKGSTTIHSHIDLLWNCSNDTQFITLVKMSFDGLKIIVLLWYRYFVSCHWPIDPPGGLKNIVLLWYRYFVSCNWPSKLGYISPSFIHLLQFSKLQLSLQPTGLW